MFGQSKPHGRDNPLWGKYKAICRDHHDPIMAGRIRVECTAIFGTDWSDWCLPCLPPGVVSIPAEGQEVWVEFEGGDPEHPVWTGVFYKGYNKSGNRLPWQTTHTTPITGSKDASEHAKNGFDTAEHSGLGLHAHPPYYDPETFGFISPSGLMVKMNDTTNTITIANKSGEAWIKLSPDGAFIFGTEFHGNKPGEGME